MKKLMIIMFMFSLVFGLAFIGCDKSPSTQRAGEEAQESVMQRASSAHPVPEINNFLTREAVVKWMERMDVPDKLFYIYILADNGAMVGYFVAQYRPVSTATFLTPTKRIERHSYGNLAIQSPSLDGTYYGEGGAASQYFFFDAETDAFIELQGLNYILMDQPLSIEVPRLKVEVQ